MTAVETARATMGTAAACDALGIARASVYRRRQPARPRAARPAPPRALDARERQTVLDTLHSERFLDQAPAQVHATLLDEGTYLCAPRTMYRLLDTAGEVKERRDQVRRPHYAAPELLATRPNEVWSWDITKLLGPAKWTYFYLYVILDIFSRYVVGWMLAPRDSATLAERLIAETCAKQGIQAGQLTIHADRGSAMRSKPVALLLAELGVTKTHSRPHVSNDNPFSEAQFKTLKPGFPFCLPRMAPYTLEGPPSARNSCRRTFVQLQRPSPQPALTCDRLAPLLSGHFSDTAPHVCRFFARRASLHSARASACRRR